MRWLMRGVLFLSILFWSIAAPSAPAQTGQSGLLLGRCWPAIALPGLRPGALTGIRPDQGGRFGLNAVQARMRACAGAARAAPSGVPHDPDGMAEPAVKPVTSSEDGS